MIFLKDQMPRELRRNSTSPCAKPFLAVTAPCPNSWCGASEKSRSTLSWSFQGPTIALASMISYQPAQTFGSTQILVQETAVVWHGNPFGRRYRFRVPWEIFLHVVVETNSPRPRDRNPSRRQRLMMVAIMQHHTGTSDAAICAALLIALVSSFRVFGHNQGPN